MYDVGRANWISWWTTLPGLEGIAALCDKQHKHVRFDPSRNDGSMIDALGGVAYPLKFCNKVAAIVGSHVIQLGTLAPRIKPALKSKEGRQRAAALCAAAGRQPRGEKLPQVIKEFKTTERIAIARSMLEELGLKQGDCVKGELAAKLGYTRKEFCDKLMAIDDV